MTKAPQEAQQPSPVAAPTAPASTSTSAAPTAGPAAEASPAAPPSPGSETFADDLAFLRKHTSVIVLGDEFDGAGVVVAPEYQGRVMTSSAAGGKGKSFGFINRKVVAARQVQPHMTVVGGEDRFWLGPEGGQFGLYFPPGAPYDFEHWQVPEPLDWGAWPITERNAAHVRFVKDMVLKNHLGTELRVRVDRRVGLLSPKEVADHLGIPLPAGAAAVGYESENTITNIGTAAWTKKTGLPSVWILGMFQPSPTTTVVLPFKPGPEKTLGKIVNDAYFGKIPSSRLRIEKNVLLFSGDGKERGKIGIPAPRALPVAGSYDATNGVLTLVQYTLPSGGAYVNSMWEEQKTPYGGDVVNSYNDGPPAPGKDPLGPFYELESSSPGAELGPGKSLTHFHRTIHVQGAVTSLDAIAKQQLGIGISEITGPATPSP
jgi:hypothetical protein